VSYPQGPGQPGENPYPQYPGGPAQPGAGQYPQPQYPPTPAYPPQYAQPQYGQQPYGQQPNPAQYRPPAVPIKERNPYASKSLIWGGVALVISIVAFFLGYYFVGLLGLYAIYVSIRGLITAFGLRTHAGLISSIFGLFLSLLAFLVTLLAAGALDSFLIPLLGG
jgi:hypothetical protein